MAAGFVIDSTLDAVNATHDAWARLALLGALMLFVLSLLATFLAVVMRRRS